MVLAQRILTFFLVTVAIAVVASSPPVLAQTPTAAQLEMLNRLPPGQRQEILRQLRERGVSIDGEEEQPEFPDLVLPPEDEELDEDLEEGEEEEPRLEIGDTLVIEFNVPESEEPPPPEEELLQQEEFLKRLKDGNPYELDTLGSLYLPGVPAIPLAGLTEEEAIIRLQAESVLRQFIIFVTRLPLEPTGVDALEPFGYDLFEGVPTTFAPATDIPVPADYVVGPGDILHLQLFGNRNEEYELPVRRDGTINFPEIGPISVAGSRFSQLKNEISERVAEQMIGVRASISLGELRSIRVFVLGDVERPGSYTVSSLSTMTNALFVSGGVKEIGSLRRIELKRNGRRQSTLDLYDLLLKGDTRGDRQLRPGDVIFVPPIGGTISVAGDVNRPAVYELKGDTTVADAIAYAGGLTPTSDGSRIKLERRVAGRGITVSDVDGLGQGSALAVTSGDVLRVPQGLDRLDNAVRLAGNVLQPGLYEWSPGMRLTDVIPAPQLLKPDSDLGYVLIRREVEPNVFIEAMSADLRAAWRSPEGLDNPPLQKGDTVHVFNVNVGRSHVVNPIIEELRQQSGMGGPLAVVDIGGRVRAPGRYPLEPGMKVSDLIRAGGGMEDSAYTIDAELTRYEVVAGQTRETELIVVDLGALLAGDSASDVVLRAYDYLSIREVPRWREQETIELRGEVQFPGVYPISQGETLGSVLARAGGLTDLAFVAGAVFTREELKEREKEQTETLANRVESDLAALSLADPGASQAFSIGSTLVTQLRNAQPTGRLVINLAPNLQAGGRGDVVLKGGDTLLVPSVSQEVTVLGEVQYPTSHLHADGMRQRDYLDRSGGLTQRADKGRIYVVRANGEVVADSGSRWFARGGSNADIRPGDTIVVPLDTDRVKPLVLWQSATQVVYNLAIAAAAVNSF